MTFFKDKTNLNNKYKIKLRKTSECLWPVYIDVYCELNGFFSDFFSNHFSKIYESVLHKITIDLLHF